MNTLLHPLFGYPVAALDFLRAPRRLRIRRRRSPQRLQRVELTQGFWLGAYEVTWEQWEIYTSSPIKGLVVGLMATTAALALIRATR